MLAMSNWEPIVFPEHALLIVEERLREAGRGRQDAGGMPLDQLALRVLIAAEVTKPACRQSFAREVRLG
jgi:hypothetical protein